MKDFVPYQEALELKQLGFDEPCFGLYAPPSKTVFLHHYGLLSAKEQVLAPLYQQAFRWFREKYQLRFCIIDDHSDNEKPYSFTSEHEYYYDTGSGNDWFNTYEEAELACLQKLIELVKK